MEEKIGPYILGIKEDKKGETAFAVYPAKRPEDKPYLLELCSVNVKTKGRRASFGKLVLSGKMKGKNITTIRVLDAMAYGIENYLVKKGVKYLTGKTNRKLAKVMGIRGYKSVGGFVLKILTEKNIALPMVIKPPRKKNKTALVKRPKPRFMRRRI